MDRGGLVHVSDSVYELFVAMEVEIRSHLRATDTAASEGVKEVAISSILDNEDVILKWHDISINWGKEQSDELLRMVVQHWTTVRGFSFASSFMEKYKQKNKKTVEKSKGLRKNLMGKSAIVDSENGDE